MAGVGGALLMAASAHATVTMSQVTVTSPSGTYVTFDQVTPATTINLTGTSDGTTSDSLDIKCYKGTSMTTLATSVSVSAGGAFSFSGLFTGIKNETCVLRAVPHNNTTDYPPGSPSSFSGPTLAIGDRANTLISGGPNNGALQDYYLYASQLRGAFDYDSLGGCAISDSYVYDPVTFASSSLDSCNAWFSWENGASQPGHSAATRSELQVDGADAYLAGNISGLGFTATSNGGFPGLTYRYSVDPASGNLVIDETDQVVKCSPGGAFPPTSSNCSSFVPAGVQVKIHVTQSQGGRVATVTQWFSSTDGQAHNVDMLEENDFYHVNFDGEFSFPWTGNGLQPYTTPGQVIAGPASGPGSFYIKGSATAPDGGESSPQGTVTFSNAPKDVTIVGTTDATSVSWVDLHYIRTVPATGSVPLGFTYSNAFLLNEVFNDSVAAEASFRPAVAITTPAGGSTLAQNSATVFGTAGDATGLTSLTVNGHSVAVAANGTWSANLPLSAGANTITALATNVFGNTTQARISLTYTPPPTPTPTAPKLALVGSPTASPTSVNFSLNCQAAAGTACAGNAILATLERLLGAKVVALTAKRPRRHSKRVAIGSLSFSLAPGQTKELVVPLNTTGRRLVTRFKRVSATLTVSLLNTEPPTVITTKTTIKASKKRKMRKRVT